jgi:hypothetical protein
MEMDIKDMGCENVTWIHLVQGKVDTLGSIKGAEFID